jgi:haloalkane dehalogenase
MAAMDAARTPEERFADLPDYPFEPRYVTLPDGLRIHFVEAGPTGGLPVLLLHGQPTWSYLYRHVIPILAQAGLRAVAPDLIGFGRSDKPRRRTDYTLGAHISWISQFLSALDLRDLTLVLQDWGGPIGLGTMAATPERVSRIVAANTALHTAGSELAGRLAWACHSTAGALVSVEPALLDYQRMTQELTEFHPSLFVQGATERMVSDLELAAYDAPFPDEAYCAGVRQLPLLMGLTPTSASARINRRSLAALAEFNGPVLTAFSDGDPSTRGWEGVLQSLAPGAGGRAHPTISGAGHFLQEDQGPALGEIIARFVAESE